MSRFEPGNTVRFTHQQDLIIGEVEEIRRGFEGDHVLVVRQGGPWSGDRYMVLSSYVEKIGSHTAETEVDFRAASHGQHKPSTLSTEH